ncbi:MAG: hypothetical protein RJA59_1265 [Pseudomonadota bacterium]
MTTTRTDWAKDNKIPPKSNEAVALIMAEKGVNRRRAYAMLREQKMAEIDTSGVGQGQRVAVLTCLITNPEAGRDAPVLLDALHRAGVKIDMHDTVKTLWALQKTRYVQFRERGGRSLYAIKITDEGLEAYERMSSTPPAIQEVAVLSNVLALANDVIVQEAEKLEPDVVEDLQRWEEPAGDEYVKRPWIKGNLGGWPCIRDILDRAEKATKINAAAKLLEEVGEDAVALELLDKTQFNPLEDEIIDLLKKMGELPE